MSHARSHPPTLITLVTRLVKASRLVAPGDRVLVGVSGGADSTALLHVLARLRKVLAFDLVAHGVDHGLRPSAAFELDEAEILAKALGVPFARSAIRVAPGGNLQARARDGRYAALEQAARAVDATCIATGHHKDDRAETVLIRLLRGTGPQGLAVLPPRTVTASGIDRIRPLLLASRRDILAHLARHALSFANDPSNVHPRFLRSRVRHELLPLMTELNAGVVDHLCHLADLELEAAGPRLSSPSALVTPLDRAHDDPWGAPAPSPKPISAESVRTETGRLEGLAVTSTTRPRNETPRRNDPKPSESVALPPLRPARAAAHAAGEASADVARSGLGPAKPSARGRKDRRRTPNGTRDTL